jgi:MFS family permease
VTEKTYPSLRRNFILLLADTILFGAAISVIGVSSIVVPAFVSQLTDSTLLIGLSSSVFSMSWLLPQLMFAQIVTRIQHKGRLMRLALPFRSTFLIAAGLVALIGGDGPASVLLFIVLGAIAFFSFSDAYITLAWADVLGSSLPDRLRGVLYGTGAFLSGVGALGISALVRWALGPDAPPFPNNYVILFGVAAVLFILGGLALAFVKEEQQNLAPVSVIKWGDYWAYLKTVLQADRGFRQLMALRWMIDFSALMVPFFFIFGKSTFALSDDQISGDYVLLIQVGTFIGSVLMGYLSRRYGSKTVLSMVGIVAILSPLFALSSMFFLGQAGLYICFALTGIFYTVRVITYIDWVIAYAPENRRPVYIGLMNTLAAVSSLSGVFGGFILQRFAQAGLPGGDLAQPFAFMAVTQVNYAPLFIASLLFAMVGCYLSIRLPEPRLRPETTVLKAAVKNQKGLVTEKPEPKDAPAK